MSLITRITALAQAIGADIKILTTNQGSLAALTTTTKTSLVAAINEVKASGGGGGATIDDNASDTSHAWSASKIASYVGTQISNLVAGAPTALDTLNEIAAALNNDATSVTGLITAVGNRVRFDAAQTLTSGQQTQACTNLGIGEPDTDLVAIYTTAKS